MIVGIKKYMTVKAGNLGIEPPMKQKLFREHNNDAEPREKDIKANNDEKSMFRELTNELNTNAVSSFRGRDVVLLSPADGGARLPGDGGRQAGGGGGERGGRGAEDRAESARRRDGGGGRGAPQGSPLPRAQHRALLARAAGAAGQPRQLRGARQAAAPLLLPADSQEPS